MITDLISLLSIASAIISGVLFLLASGQNSGFFGAFCIIWFVLSIIVFVFSKMLRKKSALSQNVPVKSNGNKIIIFGVVLFIVLESLMFIDGSASTEEQLKFSFYYFLMTVVPAFIFGLLIKLFSK